MKSAKGRTEGVLHMLDNPDVHCVDVLKRLEAVQGALSKVNMAVLRSRIRDHGTTARADNDLVVGELLEALQYRDRPPWR